MPLAGQNRYITGGKDSPGKIYNNRPGVPPPSDASKNFLSTWLFYYRKAGSMKVLSFRE